MLSHNRKGDAMRRLRWALAAAAVLTLSTSATAAADGGRPIVAPSSSHDLTTILKTFVELPAPINPRYGDGSEPCVEIGRNMLIAITFGEEVTCTAELGTVVSTGGMHFCSTFDPVDSPYYADNPKDGRACARNPEASPETGLWVSLDGGPQVDLFQPQYTAHTPPTTVALPIDNAFGVPPQSATIYGWGWLANLRNLGVGRHTYVTTVEVFGELIPFRHMIDIVPRHAGTD
jgi:hypothetical protein